VPSGSTERLLSLPAEAVELGRAIAIKFSAQGAAIHVLDLNLTDAEGDLSADHIRRRHRRGARLRRG